MLSYVAISRCELQQWLQKRDKFGAFLVYTKFYFNLEIKLCKLLCSVASKCEFLNCNVNSLLPAFSGTGIPRNFMGNLGFLKVVLHYTLGKLAFNYACTVERH